MLFHDAKRPLSLSRSRKLGSIPSCSSGLDTFELGAGDCGLAPVRWGYILPDDATLGRTGEVRLHRSYARLEAVFSQHNIREQDSVVRSRRTL